MVAMGFWALFFIPETKGMYYPDHYVCDRLLLTLPRSHFGRYGQIIHEKHSQDGLAVSHSKKANGGRS